MPWTATIFEVQRAPTPRCWRARRSRSSTGSAFRSRGVGPHRKIGVSHHHGDPGATEFPGEHFAGIRVLYQVQERRIELLVVQRGQHHASRNGNVHGTGGHRDGSCSYKGTGRVLTMIGGQIDAFNTDVVNARQKVAAGKLKMLAVMTPHRSPRGASGTVHDDAERVRQAHPGPIPRSGTRSFGSWACS